MLQVTEEFLKMCARACVSVYKTHLGLPLTVAVLNYHDLTGVSRGPLTDAGVKKSIRTGPVSQANAPCLAVSANAQHCESLRTA